jgi:dTMP kinase
VTSQGNTHGVLVALEGIDGSGKSTQARRLCAALQEHGLTTLLLHEPGDTEYGDRLRQLFQHGRSVSPLDEMRLFLEDRRIDVRDNILPALAADRVVVMDRYYFSSMAYQGALGIDPDLIREKNEAFAPRPHLTLILDVLPDTGVTRIRARRDVPNTFERVDYLLRVRELFLSFCDEDVVSIDASADAATVQAEIWRRVAKMLVERGKLSADKLGFLNGSRPYGRE